MWLAGRWPRIAVSLVGPYANLVLASIASLVALLAPIPPTIVSALSQFALLSYLMVLVNLNPLLEYDGYFVLMDLLERPNLRARSLTWLRRDCGPALRNRDKLKGHWLDLGYGLGSLLYVVVMAMVVVIFYRLKVEDLIAAVIGGRG